MGWLALPVGVVDGCPSVINLREPQHIRGQDYRHFQAARQQVIDGEMISGADDCDGMTVVHHLMHVRRRSINDQRHRLFVVLIWLNIRFETDLDGCDSGFKNLPQETTAPSPRVLK
ncbi:MAG: hypothetical protein QOI25_5350 [Mycobacterium sp.]|nr:hypothetical protein [Mycobacterium sp.]